MRFLRLCIGISILGFVRADGAVYLYSGSFTSTFDPSSPNYQGVPNISGTWSFVWDDSAGTQEQFLSLTSFALTPAFGSTIFSPANARVWVYTPNGNLEQFAIGGSLSNSHPAVPPLGTDEGFRFLVFKDSRGDEGGIFDLNVASVPGADTASTDQGTLAYSYTRTAIPEVGSVTLSMLALSLGAFCRRRS